MKSLLKKNPKTSSIFIFKKNGELIRLKNDSQTLLLDYINFFKLKDSKLYYKDHKVILKIPKTLL